MSSTLRDSPPLLDKLIKSESVKAKEEVILSHPDLGSQYRHYLNTFGDRCMEELKLESQPLFDAPHLLIDSILRLAQRPAPQVKTSETINLESEISALPHHRKMLFRWIVKHARDKVRNRENLRFERTRLFGRVRQIILRLGEHYQQAGALLSKEDVFYLTLPEALSHHNILTNPLEWRTRISERMTQQACYQSPPDRFTTRGVINPNHPILKPSETLAPLDKLQGIGACPGIIQGYVRVFTTPKEEGLKPGEILVAQQTDPGWVVLFPSASAILVERGSLLSHSAIVARELSIPCIVSVPNITTQLQTGDLVQIDGSTGTIMILERSLKN